MTLIKVNVETQTVQKALGLTKSENSNKTFERYPSLV